MGYLKQIVVDCDVPSVLARFWAAALNDFDVRPYDDEEIARLAALGYTPETDPSVIVDGPHVEICFQKVDVERTGCVNLNWPRGDGLIWPRLLAGRGRGRGGSCWCRSR